MSSRVQAGVGPGLNTSGVSSPANAATWTSFAGVTSPGARVVTSASHGKIAESQADDDVPSTIERIYDLALRSLDEQERQVGELRGRLAPVVAAGGLGSTLLARSVFARSHPEGVWEVSATIVGLAGAAVLVLAVAYLLRSRPMAFSVDAEAALDARPRGRSAR